MIVERFVLARIETGRNSIEILLLYLFIRFLMEIWRECEAQVVAYMHLCSYLYFYLDNIFKNRSFILSILTRAKTGMFSQVARQIPFSRFFYKCYSLYFVSFV